jgi:regulator of replication initiation timing
MGISESKLTTSIDKVDDKYKKELAHGKQMIKDLQHHVKQLGEDNAAIKKENDVLSMKLHLELERTMDYEEFMVRVHDEYDQMAAVDTFMQKNNLAWMEDALEREWLLKFAMYMKEEYVNQVLNHLNPNVLQKTTTSVK